MKRLRLQTGANLVEFALVTPLLLILVFGIADMSLALFDKAVITNASREGARNGMVFKVPRLTDTEIRTIVNSYCSTYLVTFGTSTPTTSISRTGTGQDSGDTLTVTVRFTYSYAVLSRLIPGLGAMNLVATTVMRME
jgi:Flp pilus assembly protein TadG